MSDRSMEFARDCERIIDSHYRALPIYSQPRPTALYGLLAAYDSHILTQMVVRDEMRGADFSPGQIQLFKSLGDGVTWALRWFLSTGQLVDPMPTSDEQAILEGARAIECGRKYSILTTMYSGLSQGIMTAEVLENATGLRFQYKQDYVAQFNGWGFVDSVVNDNVETTRQKKRKNAVAANAVTHIHKLKSHRRNGRIVLDDPTELRSAAILEYVNVICEPLHDFPSHEIVNGFSFRDFNQYWMALYAWSYAATELYLKAYHDGVPQEEAMPTQVVPRKHFIDAISAVSGLSHDIVSKITKMLQVDERSEKPDLFLQPLICGQDHIAWSAAIGQQSRFQRNLLKMMARSNEHKCLADNIIGAREAELLEKLRNRLESKGWQVATNQRIAIPDQAEIDLVGVNWVYPTEILVVEAKAVLQADEPNEVRTTTKYLKGAQKQLERSIQLLCGMALNERKKKFPFVDWEKVRHWYGVVMTPETEVGFDFDHSLYPACSFRTLKHRLKARDWTSPFRIWSAMVNRDWLQSTRKARFDFEPINLAGITFEIPRIEFAE